MYKNFKVSEQEKKEILEMHEKNGYKKGVESKQSLDEQGVQLARAMGAVAKGVSNNPTTGARNTPTTSATPSQISQETIKWMKDNKIFQGQFIETQTQPRPGVRPEVKINLYYFLPSVSGGVSKMMPMVAIAKPAEVTGNKGDWSFNEQTNKITYRTPRFPPRPLYPAQRTRWTVRGAGSQEVSR